MDAKVEERWCKFVVDTGSNITIVRPDVIEASSAKIMPTKTVLRTVTGETAPVQGRGLLRVTLGTQLAHNVIPTLVKRCKYVRSSPNFHTTFPQHCNIFRLYSDVVSTLVER